MVGNTFTTQLSFIRDAKTGVILRSNVNVQELRFEGQSFTYGIFPKDTGRKLNVHKTYQRRSGRLLNFITHFSPMSHFYAPRKRQKAHGFVTFSGGSEMRH